MRQKPFRYAAHSSRLSRTNIQGLLIHYDVNVRVLRVAMDATNPGKFRYIQFDCHSLHRFTDGFTKMSLLFLLIFSELVEFLLLDHHGEMYEVVFIWLTLSWVEDAVGAMIREIVLVFAEQSARARPFAFEVLISFCDVACNAASAGVSSGG